MCRSMAANATAEQPGLDIAGLEKLLEAEVEAWIEQARAADAAEDALFGDAASPAGRIAAGAARKRTAGKLARRKAAQARLEAEARARQEQAEALCRWSTRDRLCPLRREAACPCGTSGTGRSAQRGRRCGPSAFGCGPSSAGLSYLVRCVRRSSRLPSETRPTLRGCVFFARAASRSWRRACRNW
jgi:hypothetical protein